MNDNHAQQDSAAPSDRPIVIVEDEISQILADSPAIDLEECERLLALMQQDRSSMLHNRDG